MEFIYECMVSINSVPKTPPASSLNQVFLKVDSIALPLLVVIVPRPPRLPRPPLPLQTPRTPAPVGKGSTPYGGIVAVTSDVVVAELLSMLIYVEIEDKRE